MSEILIRGGYVLPMDRALGELPVGDVILRAAALPLSATVWTFQGPRLLMQRAAW